MAWSLALSSCSHYATFKEVRPDYDAPTPAGGIIAQIRQDRDAPPQARIGRYLDAVAAAQGVLRKAPGDLQARKDYNFAAARIFDVIRESGLEPWKTPLLCQGENQSWSFSLKPDPRPGYNPSNFELRPADRYQFKGKLVVGDARKEGLGAPLIAVSKIDLTKLDSFAQGKHAYYGVTGVVNTNGRDGTATLVDPLEDETVTLSGRTWPLAADFSAPIALALAELQPRKKELRGLFKPEEFATGTRLARLQPYDPEKIPLLCVHGLGDSQATWAPLIETLRADPVIRAHYQVWFFSYPTGYPYPLSAANLRKQLDAIKARHPDHKDIVLLGHSMGGMISRTLMTDSGMTLWNATYEKPPGEMPFSGETRRIMSDALIFKPRTDLARVIFLSPSHRGANMAQGFMGRLGSKLIGGPKNLLNGDTSVLTLAKPASTAVQLKRMPNSVDFLNPGNRFVKTLDTLPVAPGIPYHSILGDRGKGGNPDHTKPESSDGIVPYWSSHLDGAQSELIIPSGHWTNRHPQGIAEVKRILYLHLGRQ